MRALQQGIRADLLEQLERVVDSVRLGVFIEILG